MVVQHVYGLPPSQAPVLRLRAADGDMVAAYLASFERAWNDASLWTG
jgi:hypothetical protein